MDINLDLGNTIKELRNTFPAVFQTLDDVIYLSVGQWPEISRAKVEIKHQKAREDFKRDIYKNVESIPKDKITMPDVSILGPTLEASRFFIENEVLRKMFAKVAASSIDSRLQNYSRAAFVEFIKQLSPLDVKLLISLKGDIKIGINGTNEFSTIEGPGALPLIDVVITSKNHRSFFKENIAPKTLSDYFNCTYKELSSSIDNLLRLGIVSKKNSELVEWRLKETKEWFKENEAITDANNSINREIKDLQNELYNVNNPETGIKNENGHKVHYKHITIGQPHLEEKLEIAKKKDVDVNHNRTIMLTSLGRDFVKVCL